MLFKLSFVTPSTSRSMYEFLRLSDRHGLFSLQEQLLYYCKVKYVVPLYVHSKGLVQWHWHRNKCERIKT